MLSEIKPLYDYFPTDYINDISGWGFSNDNIVSGKGKLLTLDIDYGLSCSLNCPLCFAKGCKSNNGEFKIINKSMFFDIINDALKLGVRSVKFLGAGEPFENYDFLEILEFLRSKDIIPLIFTNGAVLGEDRLAKKYFSNCGIETSKELVTRLKELDVSIMLKYNSFGEDLQNKLVGCHNGYNYAHYRNIALRNLIDLRFNDKTNNPTRLAIAVNPVTKENIGEAFSIYKWARIRNIYAIVTTSMISGRAAGVIWQDSNPSDEDLINLYTRIYKFNLASGLTSIEKVKEDGISAYAGGHPCNQVACGLYVSINGSVYSCPGDDTKVEGNIWKNSLREVWEASQNKLLRSGIFNCKCIAKDGKSLPNNLYLRVINNIFQTV